ncbi:MAG: hypothetical protein D6741_06585 [Planctomycetota bacterium]|nr:MAG: hypothetical protein D6741_06585 [Planctomycetota bacterium]
MNQRRREFVLGAAAVAAGAFASGRWASAEDEAKQPNKAPGKQKGAKEKAAKPQVGIQLFAVRGEFAKDVPGTLEAIAKAGYAGVEFWGYGGGPMVYQDWTAPKLRKLLDDLGLVCCGMHVSPAAIGDDRLTGTIDVNHILGNPRVIVAAAKQQMADLDSIAKYAEYLEHAAEKAASDHVRIGYHCHPFDMELIDGKPKWVHLFGRLSPEIIMQVDCGNCAAGGGDPFEIIKLFPGRSESVHLKEFGDMTFNENGGLLRRFVRLATTVGRAKWLVVEQGGEGGNGFDIPARCRRVLAGWGL